MCKKIKSQIIIWILLSLFIASCSTFDRSAISTRKQQGADLIFIGQHIVTMAPDKWHLEVKQQVTNKQVKDIQAVVVDNGKIVFVGSREQGLAYKDNKTRVVELGEKSLLPGFIDAHGHFTAVASFINFANLSSPPVGQVTSIGELVAQLKRYADLKKIKQGQWIIGYGYDDSLLAAKRHPNRIDLDRVSTQHPVGIIHVSGHLASINNKALELLNITEQTADPAGGKFHRHLDSKKPNGVLEEAASYRLFMQILNLDINEQQALTKAVNLYASYGITTAQDGAVSAVNVAKMKQVNRSLPIDVHLFQTIRSKADYQGLKIDDAYQAGFKLSGVKFILDGSPQGLTAWMSKPYKVVPKPLSADYRGYPTINPEFYLEAVKHMVNNNIPVLAHANGDAAIDLMIKGIEQALIGSSTIDHRSVIIHAQLMRQDQLKKSKQLGVIPSFFSAHPFFWGDWHQINFGNQRAQKISPTASALELNIPFTLHNDSPIVPPDMMRLLWVTTNRQTRSGSILGTDEKISTYEALKAITMNSAYQYFEENIKGSIQQGKQADLVILSTNPLQLPPAQLQNVKVIETFAKGESIYLRNKK